MAIRDGWVYMRQQDEIWWGDEIQELGWLGVFVCGEDRSLRVDADGDKTCDKERRPSVGRRRAHTRAACQPGPLVGHVLRCEPVRETKQETLAVREKLATCDVRPLFLFSCCLFFRNGSGSCLSLLVLTLLGTPLSSWRRCTSPWTLGVLRSLPVDVRSSVVTAVCAAADWTLLRGDRKEIGC